MADAEGRADADAAVPEDLGDARRGTPISDGKLRGDAISFKAGGTTYSGKRERHDHQGAADGSWTATKK